MIFMRWSFFILAFGLAGCASSPRATAAAPADPLVQGRQIYVAKCAKCHKFYDPAKYSDEDWQMWMTRMGKKAKLKPEQLEILSRYIEDTYRSPARTIAPAKKP